MCHYYTFMRTYMSLHNANEFPRQHAEEHLKAKIQSPQYDNDCWCVDDG